MKHNPVERNASDLTPQPLSKQGALSDSPLPAAGRGAGGDRSTIIRRQPISPLKLQRAKELRQHMTEAEKVLWQALRANRLGGWHFRRQQIIGGFIVDFYCHAARLAVEVDGEIHAAQQEQDRQRSELIRQHDVDVIRFANQAVLNQLSQVLGEIEHTCRQRTAQMDEK